MKRKKRAVNTPPIFAPADPLDIDRLVARYPLALVISADGPVIQASPLPLVLVRDADGQAALVGHFARTNPQLELIRRQPRALAAFTGAQGYVSSSWLRARTNAPTWNYEVVHFDVEIELRPGLEDVRAALGLLIERADAPYANPWRIEEMIPARFEKLATMIVPFRARVLATQAQFKLGQGEAADVLEDSLAGLERHGRHELAAAMRRIQAR
jgi:transcriptional regulator